MCTEDPHSWLTQGRTPEKPCLHLDLTRTKDLGLRPELSAVTKRDTAVLGGAGGCTVADSVYWWSPLGGPFHSATGLGQLTCLSTGTSV